MLIIESKHENELEALLKNMDGCRIVHSDRPLEPFKQLEVIEGTCSACPHFQTMRGESGATGRVKWGICNKVKANVNEHRAECSIRRREVELEEREVRTVFVVA